VLKCQGVTFSAPRLLPLEWLGVLIVAAMDSAFRLFDPMTTHKGQRR